MLELTRWKSLTCAAAVATASFAVAASPAAALNPQPLPPRVVRPTTVFLNPQPLPPGAKVFLNPQPLPPFTD
jgi:hypothetical protein